jgi:hypothetical protein
MRVTPELITELKPGKCFVFGSNAEGKHLAGVAKIAHEKFGAAWGIGNGPTGLCYAINTMSGTHELIKGIDRFKMFARSHQERIFLVTPIGCGIAGYTPEQIAPLFKQCVNYENVYLPKSFWQILKP